ncbi:hypothetical protein ACFQ3S_09320 [Mucilaginibacter terrae]|uniref:hypothetical protein n=1 Tax=Mucilaginibacter terrae TaxID=1955052 RepID=UPI003632D551
MKKIFFIVIALIIFISCKEKTNKHIESKNTKSYGMTLYRDKYDDKLGTFLKKDTVFTIKSENDTTAYLSALNMFYDEKVKQRDLFNYGQPKGFLIFDKSKISLELKLPARMVVGLQEQVKSKPNVAKMLDDYIRDSLIVK